MRLRSTAVLAALVTLSCLIAPTALAQQPVCGSHKTVADTLNKRYAETPVSMGVTVGGAVVEIYASPEGTWTLLITQPNGVTCLIAAGKDWENLPKLAKGAAI